MYDVSLPHFEGPMDLLLFFVQRDELDIYDIPIAKLTDDFLEYTRHLTVVDLDAAGEFIYFAALLISIKVRTLLPRPEADDGEEPVDPRTELVERLLEYMRFKEAAALLREREMARAMHAARPVIALPVAAETAAGTDSKALHLSRLDLIRALRRVLTRLPEPVAHTVNRVRVSVAEALAALRSRLLGGEPRVSFQRFTAHAPRPFVVASLLGVLEWARRGYIRLAPAIGDDFLVEAAASALPDPSEVEPAAV